MTREEAYKLACEIMGPVGEYNSPKDIIAGTTEALMKVQEETVRECARLASASYRGSVILEMFGVKP